MHQADTIIVGGGIMGVASAFFLNQRGRSVILLESHLVGQQASGVNFGNLRQHGRVMEQLNLSNRSRYLWNGLLEIIGDRFEFTSGGHLYAAYKDEDIETFEAYADRARDHGLKIEVLSAAMMRNRFDYLSPDVRAGSFAPNDAQVNPRLATPAFGRAARAAGATIIENAPVLEMEKPGEDFRVTTNDGSVYRAPNLIVCAGAWSVPFAEMFGETAPIIVRGPQMAVTEPLPFKVEPCVLSYSSVEKSVYFRQTKRGNIVIGGCGRGPASAQERRAYVDPAVTMLQMQQLPRVMPALAKQNLIRVWSGIESYFEDDMPVVGPSATTAGLYYAFGFCGYGLQLGPAIGEALAELIDTGHTDAHIWSYGISRFSMQPSKTGASEGV